MTDSPSEVSFYQLERQPLERVLPGLLERTLERNWRAVVQVGSQERMEALDSHLWTYADDSFLPHGTKKDGAPEAQPVFLTTETDNPSSANIRFLVDGATIEDYRGYVRIVVIFDGRDEDALQQARAQWRAAKGQGCAVTYWQQTEAGRWEKKA